MTPQEKQAKREWGTGACQVRGCTTRAAYLVLETSPGGTGDGEWWQYCCPEHARHFADRHGLELPAQASGLGGRRRPGACPHNGIGKQARGLDSTQQEG